MKPESPTLATPAAPAVGEEAAKTEDEGLGISASLGFESIYNWRGANLFMDKKLNDQNGMLNPAFSYTTGNCSISYWGAFQLMGDSRAANNKGGVGSEQDVLFGYEHPLDDAFTLSFTLATYFYPMAKKAQAGTALPFYLEPFVAGSWSGPVDVKLAVSYYYGVQDAVKGTRHLYVNPTVAKSIEFSESVGLDLTLGLGQKLITGDDYKDNNKTDAVFTANVPIKVGEGLTLAPNVNAGWSKYKGAKFGDSVMTYGGLNLTWEK